MGLFFENLIIELPCSIVLLALTSTISRPGGLTGILGGAPELGRKLKNHLAREHKHLRNNLQIWAYVARKSV